MIINDHITIQKETNEQSNAINQRNFDTHGCYSLFFRAYVAVAFATRRCKYAVLKAQQFTTGDNQLSPGFELGTSWFRADNGTSRPKWPSHPCLLKYDEVGLKISK